MQANENGLEIGTSLCAITKYRTIYLFKERTIFRVGLLRYYGCALFLSQNNGFIPAPTKLFEYALVFPSTDLYAN